MNTTSAIAEMLLQSPADERHLLPAIPKVWAVGGILAGLKLVEVLQLTVNGWTAG
jgi:hypothetical protein